MQYNRQMPKLLKLALRIGFFENKKWWILQVSNLRPDDYEAAVTTSKSQF